MAKCKIVWSNRAKKRLYGIFESDIRKNESKSRSKKLNRLFSKKVKLILKHPDLGLKTTDDQTLGLIIENYIVFYQVTEDKIIIHTIWDYKQQPDNMIIN